MPIQPSAPGTFPLRERDVYTVSRLNREVRGLLEGTLGSIWLEAEISNFARPASGHWYFSLKDESAQVRCAMFRQRNAGLGMVPREGMRVLVRARVGLYEPRGEFQLVVDHLEEAGEGELRRRLEVLKRRLAAEGLFDAERKRPLPPLPGRIGVVTSPTGAAFRDILHVLRRRFPAIPVLLYPVPVQGEGAAAQIAAAIAAAAERAEVDVLIIARGGGSLEDLWAFNEEAVVRAIAACPLPIVTGVGHEVDFTIADLAADVRAPTPSAAAELVVPDASEWLRSLSGSMARLAGAWRRAAARREEDLGWVRRRLAQLHPGLLVERQAQRLDELWVRMGRAARVRLAEAGHQLAARRAELLGLSPAVRLAALSRRLDVLDARLRPAVAARVEHASAELARLAGTLHAVSPLATLERGYSITRRIADGRLVVDAAEAAAGTELEVRLASGTLEARVTRSRPD